MKVFVSMLGEDGRVQGEVRTVTLAELVEVWRRGGSISAPPTSVAGEGKKPKLDCADLVMVSVDLDRLPLVHVLNAPFTESYLTAAVYRGDGSAGHIILAFRLSKTSTDGRYVSLVMKGLEALYAGAVAHDFVLQGFGGGGLDSVVAHGRCLSIDAEKMLARLGKETVEFNARQYIGTALPRSQHRLYSWTEVSLGDGHVELLDRIPPETAVLCPVHIDHKPQARVLRGEDGTPIVVCAHCRRTFGQDRSRRYDFGFSDRVFSELAEEESGREPECVDPRQFSIIQERFLPALPLLSGITLIKSGKGTGKTTKLTQLVKDCREKGLRVLLIGHRRTLLQSLAEKVGLTNYFEADDEKEWTDQIPTGCKVELLEFIPLARDLPNRQPVVRSTPAISRIGPTDYYAVSLDSLVNLKPETHQYDVVIIDECEQVFAHLISTTLREKRKPVYLRLAHYLRVAKSVYLLDADLNMITLDTLFHVDIRPDTAVRVIINQPVSQPGATYVYPSEPQWMECFAKAVEAGEKCFVASNSIKEVKRLAEVAEKSRKGVRVVCIHSENSHTPETQRLIRNLARELEHNIDVLIASPALGTGVDISYRDSSGNPRTVVSKVFGKFLPNITTHFDIDQALMRVREPGEVHVWVSPQKYWFECQPVVLREMLEDCVKETHQLIAFADDGKPVLAPADGLVDIWARITAASRGSKNELSELFTTLRRKNGFSVEFVPLDEAAAKLGDAKSKAAQALLKEGREIALLDAEQIDGQTAAELAEAESNGVSITDDERTQLERYRIERFYCDELSSELIAFDGEGRMRKKIQNIECLFEPESRLKEQDNGESTFMLPFDRRLRSLRRVMLSKLLGAASLYDAKVGVFDTSGWVEQATLTEFVRLMLMWRKRVQIVFGIVMRRDVERNPVQQLRVILEQVGLTLGEPEAKVEGDRKIRRYCLEATGLNAVLAIVSRRETERQKREEKSAADSSPSYVIQSGSDELSGSAESSHTVAAVSRTPAGNAFMTKLQAFAQKSKSSGNQVFEV